jgi:hypothetical protein
MATSQVPFMKMLGVGLTLAILVDTTLIRAVFMRAAMNGQQPQPEGAQDIFGFLLHDQGGLEFGDEFVDSGGLGEHAEVVVDVGEVNSNLPDR